MKLTEVTIQLGVEQTIAKFLEMAKQMECFFLQKRLLLSAQKPEQIVREDITDLKAELNRKELLIQKHYDKIQFWQSLLSNLQGPGPRPAHMHNQTVPPPPPPHTQSQQHQMSNMSQAGPSPLGPTTVPSPLSMMQVNQPMPQVSQGPPAAPMQSLPPAPCYGPPPPQMGSGMVQPGQHPSMHSSGLQGPLAYLEKTTSNIGMPEPR